MDDPKLLTILRAHERQSVGYYNSEIADEQRKALEYYKGEKFGDEKDGHSQVVSHDVAEVIDWMIPSCARVFLSTDNAVNFKARGFGQEKIAELATAYCNYVVHSENDAFRIVHDVFKDGFLQKIGVAKIYWEDSERYEKEDYESLTLDETNMLRMDKRFEITNSDEIMEEGMDEPTGYNVSGRRSFKNGKVCIETIPPEEFLISSASANVETADYTAHRCLRTKSDLMEMGFKWKDLEDLSDEGEQDWDQRKQERFEDEDFTQGNQTEESDPSMVKVQVLEEYVRVDYDDDNIAELRQIIRVGDKILSNEEVDETPWAVYTPIIMPHKAIGMSLADKTMDIQRIASTIWRQMNDNLYLSNNPRMEMPEQAIGEHTIDDSLNNRVGGIIRTAVPGLLSPIVTPDMSAGAMRGIEFINSVRQRRTGITETNQGLATDTLNPTMGGAAMIMDAANEQKDFYVRNFAETFYKTKFRKVLNLLVKYQDWSTALEVNGEWVEINPQAFDPDMHVEVQVGLGTGNKQARVQNALQLMTIQQQAVQYGMAGPQEFYNSAKELTDAMGMKSTQMYFIPPEKAQPPQQQPDPKMVEAQMKMQIEQQKMQLEQQKTAHEQRLKEAEMMAEQDRKERQLQFEARLKAEQFNVEVSLKERQFNFEKALSTAELHVDAAVQHEKNQMSRSVRFGGEPG